MKLRVEVEGVGEPLVAEIDARDRRAFEREGMKDLGAPPLAPLKDVTAARPESFTGWLAWHALKRTGQTDANSWAEFEPVLVGTVLDQPDDDEADALGDPTSPVG